MAGKFIIALILLTSVRAHAQNLIKMEYRWPKHGEMKTVTISDSNIPGLKSDDDELRFMLDKKSYMTVESFVRSLGDKFPWADKGNLTRCSYEVHFGTVEHMQTCPLYACEDLQTFLDKFLQLLEGMKSDNTKILAAELSRLREQAKRSAP